MTRLTNRMSPRSEKTLIEDESNRPLNCNFPEIGMPRVQQVVVLDRHDCGADLKNGRIARIDPLVDEPSLVNGTGLDWQVFNSQHADVLRH